MTMTEARLVDANPVDAYLQTLSHVDLYLGFARMPIEELLEKWPIDDLP